MIRSLWCHSLNQVPHWFTLTTENIERREGWTEPASTKADRDEIFSTTLRCLQRVAALVAHT
jgi:hypothetical protein